MAPDPEDGPVVPATHYAFVRDWHDDDQSDPAVIVVKADPTVDDPFADAETRASSAGEEHWAGRLGDGSFEDATYHVLVVFTDLADLVEVDVLRA